MVDLTLIAMICWDICFDFFEYMNVLLKWLVDQWLLAERRLRLRVSGIWWVQVALMEVAGLFAIGYWLARWLRVVNVGA